jgi:hypothetical protein
VSAIKTELDVAKAIASGALPSPTTFFNGAFFSVRISGTGTAWRPALNEFCWREPAIWLSAEMVERVRGLPIVWRHPIKGMLDTETFASTVVGTITYAWVQGTELWGVARILDADAAALIGSGDFDTSPSAIFVPDANTTITLADGEKLVVEIEPALIDHLALIANADGGGVWTKGDRNNTGVEIST